MIDVCGVVSDNPKCEARRSEAGRLASLEDSFKARRTQPGLIILRTWPIGYDGIAVDRIANANARFSPETDRSLKEDDGLLRISMEAQFFDTCQGDAGSSLHQRVLFLFVAEVAITHADYSVLPTSPSYPSATITVKEPACARDLAATSATTGKNPCGEGILQCPVEQTVSPVSIGVVATDASRSVITPVPPVNYFFEGDADGEQSVKIATDPGLGVVTLYYTPPLGAINGTSARAVLHLRRGVPDAPTSGVVCTLTVIWTVLSRVDNAVASVQGGVVRPAPAPAASRAQAPTGPALRTSTAPAGVPSI